MKKRIVLSFLIILCVFMISGCTNDKQNNSNNKGAIYKQISLEDKGITMFTSVVPEKWSASIFSQDLVNSSYPFVNTIVIASPDKEAKITILSQHSYTDNDKYSEGENKEYYTTYLHSMDAGTYLDYFMNRVEKVSSAGEDKEVDSILLDDLKQLHDLKIQLAKSDVQQIGTSNYGVNITIGDEGYTSSKKDYQEKEKYYEAWTSVSSISSNLTSSVSGLLNSKSTVWYVPYVIIYEADSKEAFDKYYNDYNFIIQNSSFTKDYYAMIEYVSSAITNAYTTYYAQKAKAGLDAVNDYIDSNYSSDSSSSTQDRVREMWSDVIKEQDNYILEDGSSIKTSIRNDVVAQKGDEIYVGSKGGIPYGFNILEKGY